MKIAIAGFGLEGRANYDYWSRGGEHDLTIADESKSLPDIPTGAKVMFGADALSRLGDFDMVIRTAGLNPHKIKTNGKIWSATNEFFAKCPAPIIGVTGTKGKGTTCSLITSILKAAGKKVHLVGNIGVSALETLPQISASDIVVFELSSFQLWDIEYSPHIAVVLGIEPDHLDIHENFEEYVQAKAQIVAHQTMTDTVVFNQNNQYSTRIAEQSQAKKVGYPFAIDEFVSSLQIPGPHNIENASAAVAAVREAGVSNDEIRSGLASFSGLPHRLKFVREVGGVEYYDDSIATTPGSAIAAIHSFIQPKILILGGKDKGADYSALIDLCKTTKTRIVATGGNGKDIQTIAQDEGMLVDYVDGSMADIVTFAQGLSQSGDIVILSPAASSFDQYKNYTDRGDQFVAAVNSL